MESVGTILTRVYTSRAQLPVEGATVAFLRRDAGGKRTLLAVRVTDRSGRTAPVEVPTPALSASEAPGGGQPFAVCDIWAEAPGYELQAVDNVQIFPGTQTLQELELVPLPERAPAGTAQPPVDIPPQDL